MAREVCEICGGTGIAVQPIAYEDAAGTVQHAVSRIACWGCDYGKRHTLSELDALNTERERGAAAMAREDVEALLRAALAEVEQQQNTIRRLEKMRMMVQQRNHELMNKLEIVLREVASSEPLSPALIWQAKGWVQSLDEKASDDNGDE